MNTRKGMKLILFGAAVLLLIAINVSADEPIPEVRTTSVEAPEEIGIEHTSVTIDHDAEDGELIIAPYEDVDNLVKAEEGAEGDIFILGTGNQMESEKSLTKKTNAPFNFPALLSCSALGIIGCLYFFGKRQE